MDASSLQALSCTRQPVCELHEYGVMIYKAASTILGLHVSVLGPDVVTM